MRSSCIAQSTEKVAQADREVKTLQRMSEAVNCGVEQLQRQQQQQQKKKNNIEKKLTTISAQRSATTKSD